MAGGEIPSKSLYLTGLEPSQAQDKYVDRQAATDTANQRGPSFKDYLNSADDRAVHEPAGQSQPNAANNDVNADAQAEQNATNQDVFASPPTTDHTHSAQTSNDAELASATNTPSALLANATFSLGAQSHAGTLSLQANEPQSATKKNIASNETIASALAPSLQTNTLSPKPNLGVSAVENSGTVLPDSSDTLLAETLGPGANRSADNALANVNTELAAASANTSASANSVSSNTGTAPNQTNQGATPAAPAINGAPSPDASALQANLQTAPTPAPTADAAPTSGATATTQSTSASSTITTAPTTAAAQTLANAPQASMQVHARFIERFDGRAQQFEVRLDPAELGRVNVRIEINADNRVSAILSTHDSNALNDLLRGQRALEQALADSGIDLTEDGIEFQLADRDNQNFQSENESNTSQNNRRGTFIDVEIEDLKNAETLQSLNGSWPDGRLNIVA